MDAQHRSAHHITFNNLLEGDSCSATAVGPHTLLTAGHCLMASSEIGVDGKLQHIESTMFDDADHMLIVTDADFADWLPINQVALATITEGTPVHMWGNPGKRTDLFRTGAFEKWEHYDETTAIAVFGVPIYAGDSGAGLLNDAGEVIAVVSLGDKSVDTACFQLQFSDQQLAEIR